MAEIELRRAVWEALDEELTRDERVILYGEDIAVGGGVFQVTRGLLEKHGASRVFDTPISELALSVTAFGSAVAGLRPVIEIMFADFIALAMDAVINQSAKYWYLSNGQGRVPLVIRTTVGAGGRFGAIHSQVPVPWMQAIPGLKLVAPSTPHDAKALLIASIQDDNPIVFFEHKRLYTLKGEVRDEAIELGRANVVRSGRDLTIVTAMKGVHDSLAAAEALAARDLDVEVIDLRTLRPLDVDTILESVARTGRLVVVEEGPRTGGWAAEVLAVVTEEGLSLLDDAWRIAMPDHPLPYSPPLEDAVVPGAERIAADVAARLGLDPVAVTA